jgi:glucose-6-phosphate isomerase
MLSGPDAFRGLRFFLKKSEDSDVADLNGKLISELFAAEAIGTSTALMKAGNPMDILNVDRIDAYTMGMLFMHFQLETAITGLLMGINPFDQPGVELGKIYAHAIMGRKDLVDSSKEIESFRNSLTEPREEV